MHEFRGKHMQNKPKRRTNWGNLIGWIIFLLVVAGGPLLSMLSSALGRGGSLPRNLVPILIGALVALSVLVSAVRALANSARSRSDTRLPTTMSTPQRPPSAPMPPFGGTQPLPQRRASPPASPRGFTLPPSSAPARLPPAPGFEPVINPTILVLGIVGLIVLGGVALFVFLGISP